VVAAHCARLAGDTAPRALWSAAAALDTSTLFGRFRIDARTGVQMAHDMVLVRWSAGTLAVCR
jgi:branched-chain amino acid transport system substrate-binding protein